MDEKLQTLFEEIRLKKAELLQLQREIGRFEEVSDYTFHTDTGAEVRLSELFNETGDLIVIHNMGRGCNYCTLWADGLNSIWRHLARRTGFVLGSPDAPEKQAAARDERGWTFPMISHSGTTFSQDMGFYNAEHGYHLPGYSTFHRDASGKISRIACDVFGPGDDYCSVWPMLDRLKDGPNGWEPQ